MSIVVGMNLDPTLYDDPKTPLDICANAGFQSVRITVDLRRNIDQHRRFEEYARTRGMRPLRVLCRESFTENEWSQYDFRGRIRKWLNDLGPDADWEAGNEPDPGGGASSATMTVVSFATLIHDTRQIVGDNAFVVSGGLVGGNPDWVRSVVVWAAIRDNCNAFGNHLYEMCPDGFAPAPFQERYLRYWVPAAVSVARDLNLPLWITEIGAGHKYFATPQLEAEFFLHSYAQLQPHVGAIYPFSYEGVDDYTLCAGNVPSLSWNVAAGLAQAQSKEEGESKMTIEELAAKHGGVYGKVFVFQGVGPGTAKIAFVNDKPGRYVLEINGEADGPFDRSEDPKA